MRMRTLFLLALMAVASATPSRALAQGCLPADENALALRNYALRLATETSPVMDSTRARYQLVTVAPTEVAIVTDRQTCEALHRAR